MVQKFYLLFGYGEGARNKLINYNFQNKFNGTFRQVSESEKIVIVALFC